MSLAASTVSKSPCRPYQHGTECADDNSQNPNDEIDSCVCGNPRGASEAVDEFKLGGAVVSGEVWGQ
jgi:hypothetical protein